MTAQPELTLHGTAPALPVDLDHAEGQTHALTGTGVWVLVIVAVLR